MTDLKGKTALVAGSTSGIGIATGSPDYQQLMDVRGVAMDARFRLLDGLPTPTANEGKSE